MVWKSEYSSSVHHICAFPPSEPYLQLVTVMNNITTSLGQTADLHCHVLGKPKPTFQWLKNDAPVVPEPRRISFKTNDFGSRLRIRNLDTTDTGYFQCVAKNIAGTVSTTGILYVKFGECGGLRRWLTHAVSEALCNFGKQHAADTQSTAHIKTSLNAGEYNLVCQHAGL